MLFERMVESQKGEADDTPRRTDDDVWRAAQSSLPDEVKSHMSSREFETDEVKVRFDHAESGTVRGM